MECGQMGNEASIPALVSPNALQLVTFEIFQAPVCRRLHSDAMLWPSVPGSPRMLLGRLLQMPPNAPGGSRMPSRFRSVLSYTWALPEGPSGAICLPAGRE